MKLLNFLLNSAGAFEFNPAGFTEMLPYMAIGMLVIFVLIGMIILATLLINKIFSKKQ